MADIKPKKKKENKKELSTNQYINLADVRGNALYTKDNMMWQFLKVQPISTALLTDDEKKRLTLIMTRELSPLRIPFKILFLTRPTDVRQIIEYYEAIKSSTSDTKKRDNLTKTIRYFSGLATGGGVLERQTYIAIWANTERQKEELPTKLTDFKNALLTSGVTCSICDETDIINMVGLFYNPVFSLSTIVDRTPRMTQFTGLEVADGY